jgi:hypothetical protein
MRAMIMLIAGVCMAAAVSPTPAAAGPPDASATTAAAPLPEVSAQRRRRPRITVRPLRPREPYGRDLSNWKRDCVPIFVERNIPQWGGRVIYASQRCRWVRED